ncbi:hypothetical protein LX73_0730 [Fodinibius salinus]|uniref:Uncharacterized protein n=1 Tax=Fodinibius salinus TaxID=860790 RepID=A0A5D3YNQ0_9BACT|nr:hypothetical protein [Fodinibius salinus]TYP95427.1 hypothetical protein LX73_0730 [Fodinibius salinus]
MNYSKEKHSHNFAIWAAARATQRAFTSTENLKKALEDCGILDFIKNPDKASEFDNLHKKWCNSICKDLKKEGINKVTYGRAAKLVNCYLKSRLVLKNLESEEAYYIHPPIDRILLQNLSKSETISKEKKKWLKGINWTQLNMEEYFRLINFLRKFNGDKPFWMIERHWKPAGNT